MYAVIMSCRKDSGKEKVAFDLMNAEDVLKFIEEDIDITFNTGKVRGEVCFFENREDAEASMKIPVD